MIEDLRKDVENLISLFERVKAENRRISEELQSVKTENAAYREHILELESQIDNFRLKEAFRSSGDDESAKEKLDGIIREIDRCITMLEG